MLMLLPVLLAPSPRARTVTSDYIYRGLSESNGNPAVQIDLHAGTSVAAAEVTGAIALLMSAADQLLTTDAIPLFLKGTSGGTDPAASIPPTINVSAALERLDLDQHPGPIGLRPSGNH